ncbi:exported hypothetical protein [Candidatus Xenohaliotis californiensis]|uniref:Outer membrane protein beta-barrel domain-containing protein n=1 Tax=Candidatus Xenohaliotis californiensis TaxID=84677 RepID=A0ABP0EUZ3_9RICK|nr:exported hypothetical protein [Candidatus Xenohaliotis californiensis]
MKFIILLSAVLITSITYNCNASFFTKSSLVIASDSNKIITEIKDMFGAEEKQSSLSLQSIKPQFYTSAGYTINLTSGSYIDLELGYKKDFSSKSYSAKSTDPENFLDLLTKCKTQAGIVTMSYIFDIPNTLNLKPFILLGAGVSFIKIKLAAAGDIGGQENEINLNKLTHIISTGQIGAGMSLAIKESFELVGSYSFNNRVYGSEKIKNVSISVPNMVAAKADIIKPNAQHMLSIGIKFNT